MLHFTEQALSAIQGAIRARPTPPGGLRVGVAGSQCAGLRYLIRLEDAPASDDRIVEQQGLSLFIDSDSLGRLQGVEVDFVDDGGRRGFTFDNPNLAQGCAGCTKSD